MRSEQREATRQQIIQAALKSMMERGYDAVTTRYIASVAEVSQGLLTYHFKSKTSLWQAAADHLFKEFNQALKKSMPDPTANDPQVSQREFIRQLVYFNAEHPELLRFIVDRGSDSESRTEWLVDTHIKPTFQKFTDTMIDIPEKDLPHMFYALAGACGTIFNVPLECKRTTGINPMSKQAVKAHADYLAQLFIPNT